MKKYLVAIALLLALAIPGDVFAAIAFDSTSTKSTTSSGAGFDFNHTATGSNLVLMVSAESDNGVDRISGITYNGVAMTRLFAGGWGGVHYYYFYYLIAPATGTNVIHVTTRQDRQFNLIAATYTGVDQTSFPSVGAQGNGTNTSVSAGLTTTVDNSWLVFAPAHADSDATAAGANTTLRAGITGGFTGQLAHLDSNGPKSPAGAYTLAASWGSSVPYEYQIVALAPAPEPPAPLASLLGLVRAWWF